MAPPSAGYDLSPKTISHIKGCRPDLRNRQRAFRILQLHHDSPQKRVGPFSNPGTTPAAGEFVLLCNRLLDFIAPSRAKSKKNWNDRIQATAKVLSAIGTLTGTRIHPPHVYLGQNPDQGWPIQLPAEDWFTAAITPALHADGGGIKPRDEIGGVFYIKSDDMLIQNQRIPCPKPSLVDLPLAPAVANGIGVFRKQQWRYQACQAFCYKTLVDEELGWADLGYAAPPTMRACPTPEDGDSLWAALQYCLEGHMWDYMRLKSRIFAYFNFVISEPNHPRYRMYCELQALSIAEINTTSPEARADWGQLSIMRCLANNDRDGSPAFPQHVQLFQVIADFFGTEVVLFSPPAEGLGSEVPDDEGSIFRVRVVGSSNLDTPDPGSLAGNLAQILLVGDDGLQYFMPVASDAIPAGFRVDTRPYDGKHRYFKMPWWVGTETPPPDPPLLGGTEGFHDQAPYLDGRPRCPFRPGAAVVELFRSHVSIRLAMPIFPDHATRSTWKADRPPVGADDPRLGSDEFAMCDGQLAQPRFTSSEEKKAYDWVRRAYLDGIRLPTIEGEGSWRVSCE